MSRRFSVRFRQFRRGHSNRPLVCVSLVLASILTVVGSIRWWSNDITGRADQNSINDATLGPNRIEDTTTSFRILKGVDFRELDDANRDGWDTEVLSEIAHTQLNLLGEMLANDEINAQQIGQLVRENVSMEPLLPRELEITFRDAELKIERMAAGHRPEQLSGVDNFIRELQRVRKYFGEHRVLQSKFKIVQVEKESDHIRTRQIGSVVGIERGQATCEQHFTWSIDWLASRDSMKIASIDIESFGQATRQSTTPLLADCTEAVVGKNESYREQFLKGFSYWLERLQDNNYYAILGSPGIAIGDVNGDGLDDLYVCQEAGLPNRLFLHQPDGSALDVSQIAKVDWLERTRSALLVDVDNDGDQDLIAAMMGNIVVAANNGAGQFQVKSALPCGDDTMSICAADVDIDGDLDIYVCVHNPNAHATDDGSESMAALDRRIVYHDANNAAPNHLFRNDCKNEQWQFSDVTKEVGLDQNNRRFTFSAAWEDYDNDGDQDLYVANDFGRNNLFRNDRDKDGFMKFVDVAAETNTEDSASGMSVTWGDFDRDGRADLYVSNMFSAAGRRITNDSRFKSESPLLVKHRLKRFARGNTLMRNQPSGTFQDLSDEAAVTMGRWAWSSNFVDLNNDGWEDLVVANGFITGQDKGDL